ncbi:MAG: hypothetical protein V4733_08430 [Verrucomicrobiota bacterium]
MSFETCISACNRMLSHELATIRMYEAAEPGEFEEPVLTQASAAHLSNALSLRVQIRMMGGTPCSCEEACSGLVACPEWEQLISRERDGISRYLEALAADEFSGDVRDLIRFTLVPDLKYAIQVLKHAHRRRENPVSGKPVALAG